MFKNTYFEEYLQTVASGVSFLLFYQAFGNIYLLVFPLWINSIKTGFGILRQVEVEQDLKG